MLEISAARARVRISGGRGAAIDRALLPTPYAAELIAEDLDHAGRGARIEIDAEGVATAALAAIEQRLERYRARGVQVTWRR